MSVPGNIDLRALRRIPEFAFYFRYPLHHADFAQLRLNGRLRGYYAAKPLYGKLKASGRVDRSAGFDGQVAVIFIPSPARSLKSAQLLVTRMPKSRVTRSDEKRNWPAIRAAAEAAIVEKLEVERAVPSP